MQKIAVVILADTDTPEAMGRVANALTLVQEAKGAEDDVELIFDGAGVKWVREFSKPEHRLKGLYEAVKDRVGGACEFCAGAFGVKEAVRSAGVALLGEFDGHPSLRERVARGYQVITF